MGNVWTNQKLNNEKTQIYNVDKEFKAITGYIYDENGLPIEVTLINGEWIITDENPYTE